MAVKHIDYTVKTTGKDPKNPFLQLNRLNQTIIKEALQRYIDIGLRYPVTYDKINSSLGRQQLQNGQVNSPRTLVEGLLAKLRASSGVNDFSVKTSQQFEELSKIMNQLDSTEPVIKFRSQGVVDTRNPMYNTLFG